MYGNAPKNQFIHWEAPELFNARKRKSMMIAIALPIGGAFLLNALLILTADSSRSIGALPIILGMMGLAGAAGMAFFVNLSMAEKNYPPMRVEGERLVVPFYNVAIDMSRPFTLELMASRTITTTTYVYQNYDGGERGRHTAQPAHSWATLRVHQDGQTICFHQGREVVASRIGGAIPAEQPAFQGTVVHCAQVPEIHELLRSKAG